VAVGVGILALSLIGGGLASGEVRPVPEDGPVVVPSTPASPPPTPSPSSAAPPPSVGSPSATSGPPRQLASVGGTAVVRCTGPSAYLVSWSPAQGYEADDVHRGPGRTVSVLFRGGGQHVWLAAHCVAGIPERIPDHHDD
jgi:hypothetical protein